MKNCIWLFFRVRGKIFFACSVPECHLLLSLLYIFFLLFKPHQGLLMLWWHYYWVQALNSLLLTGWTIYFFHRVHMVIVQRIRWYKWEHSSFSFVIKVINSFYPLGILYCHNSTTSVDLDSFNCSHLACLIKTCLKVNMYVLCFTILDNISNTHSTNHIKER